ncbi:MAG: thioredoxin family protein [Bacteroidales bacterium]|nr:thioredoxin family protein [Bacteroidales bacterium]
MNNIKSLDIEQFRELILDYKDGSDAKYKIKRNTIIEFYLTMCAHCVAMWKIVEQAEQEFPDIDFYKIEASEHPKLAEIYDVRGTPTFVLIPLKGHIKIVYGEMSLDKFVNIIKETFS